MIRRDSGMRVESKKQWFKKKKKKSNGLAAISFSSSEVPVCVDSGKPGPGAPVETEDSYTEILCTCFCPE